MDSYVATRVYTNLCHALPDAEIVLRTPADRVDESGYAAEIRWDESKTLFALKQALELIWSSPDTTPGRSSAPLNLDGHLRLRRDGDNVTANTHTHVHSDEANSTTRRCSAS